MPTTATPTWYDYCCRLWLQVLNHWRLQPQLCDMTSVVGCDCRSSITDDYSHSSSLSSMLKDSHSESDSLVLWLESELEVNSVSATNIMISKISAYPRWPVYIHADVYLRIVLHELFVSQHPTWSDMTSAVISTWWTQTTFTAAWALPTTLVISK